ncbi:retrotransposon hot spot (RHS) protein, putative [Trypanosoma brucei brucei TREU927]|uniref:Retrotransposon hot spot (RHS) protein, putative n=1 Tax=Trypanosoma brucei brucei (strain 927/4 GUTat10.1) TaxID=185431 RepID=Q57UU7_TRYB2|nr:retrotransposon hot spot (RHS) protein, putative [Trypanosoma brucei brucei TREU927]AAX70630.1 retrotransposon hot spot (RHS) protein, putative [Trypanosoma brucei]AAZ10619.1 retrotransposon hot spot (RHS) protein, putative [Trypanosoma brucei brucei TREU927]
MRRPRDEHVAPPPAQPPQMPQRYKRFSDWKMNSTVRDFLLEEYATLPKMNLHDFLNQCFSNTYNTVNVSMETFVKNPEDYIKDAEILEDIQGLYEFREYKRIVEKLPETEMWINYLKEEKIFTISDWVNGATPEVKNSISPVARGRLNAVQHAVTESEVWFLPRVSVKSCRDVYDSFYNAKWSYVMSGYDAEPLGMKVFDGRPQRIWTEAELNITPKTADFDARVKEGSNGLEIFVLTSEKGWPYNRFVLGYTERCKTICKHVYIRREIMRVWYIIQRGLKAWWMEATAEGPPIHIIIGTSGIGKTCGLGSFLFYSLLHFNEGMLDVVAYFLEDAAFLIYNREGEGRGTVDEYKRWESAVAAINKMKSESKGHIVMDTRYAMEELYTQLPSDVWSVTFLTFPKSAHFDEWSANKGGHHIIINCDDVRDMKAFMAWKKLSIHTGEKVSNRRRYELKREIEDEWKIVEGRINLIGPLPRYIFGLGCYEWHLKSVYDALRAMKKSDKYCYNDIIEHTADWRNDEVMNKLVKIVRVKGNVGGVESYKCQALSLMIRNMMMN